MNNKGVLLPISSLPSPHYIGDFGPSFYQFVNWLKVSNYSYWQILPLNPVGSGNSPYTSICSNAIDIRYISLDILFDEGYLKERVESIITFKTNYELAYSIKSKYLKDIYISSKDKLLPLINDFKKNNPWVINYALFMVFSSINQGKNWNEWDKKYINYLKIHHFISKKYLDNVNYHIFTQYIAFKQWKNALTYARNNGVSIIADMPFYVGFNSVECWSNYKLFSIDKNYNQTEVGGVPPDYFSKDGQLWGSPIYNFKKMKKDNYKWFISRISHQLDMCDILRIDHFRAFDTYYVIPANEKTAINGKWEKGPGKEFFDIFFKKYPTAKLIAEDLGDLFNSVYELRDSIPLPGMFVAEFHMLNYAFWPNENTILYTGTHDNQTFKSWFDSLNENDLNILRDRIQSKGDLYTDLMNAIYNLPSKITIFPIQDLLYLNDLYRINKPGLVNKDNWTFKLKDFNFVNDIKFFRKEK